MSPKSTRVVQSDGQHTIIRSHHAKLHDRSDLELGDIRKNRDFFTKDRLQNTKCTTGLQNESQEEMVGNDTGIIKTTEVSLEFSGVERPESKGSDFKTRMY
jgi:hypothetical protein